MSHPPCILYHADCLDGFGAAYAAWRFFAGSIDPIPLHHGEAWPEERIAHRDVFVLDFSFPPAKLRQLASRSRSLTLLDHHSTACRAWQGLLQVQADGSLSYRDPDHPLHLHFDLDKSGARLAWEYFFPGTTLPPALMHIEDIDLWRFRHPESRPFCRALRLEPWSLTQWDNIVRASEQPDNPSHLRMIATGLAIDRFFTCEVERLANSPQVQTVYLPGEPVDPLQCRRHGLEASHAPDLSRQLIAGLGINANALFASELGNRLAERSGTFALIWQMGAYDEVLVSLRAKGQVNVARLAEHFGGGGHPNAAGFRMSRSDFFSQVWTPKQQ